MNVTTRIGERKRITDFLHPGQATGPVTIARPELRMNCFSHNFVSKIGDFTTVTHTEP